MDFCCQRVEEDRSHNNIKSCLRFRLAGLFDLVTTKRDQETAVDFDFEQEIIRESREEAFVWSDLVSQLKSHLPTDQLDRPVWGLVIHGLATSELKKNCETNCTTDGRTATSKYLPSQSSFILFATHPSAEE